MTEPTLDRKLAAILAADMVGYSRLMEADEAGTLARHKACREEVIVPTVAHHRGRVFKTTGDGFLAEFGRAIGASAAPPRCSACSRRAMTA